jgi:hypothetical protein
LVCPPPPPPPPPFDLCSAAHDTTHPTSCFSCALRSPNGYYNDGFPDCCAQCAPIKAWCETTMPLNEVNATAYWSEWNTSECTAANSHQHATVTTATNDGSAADERLSCPTKWRRGTVYGGTYPPGGDEPANYRWCRDVAKADMPIQRLPCDPVACDPGCRPVYNWCGSSH